MLYPYVSLPNPSFRLAGARFARRSTAWVPWRTLRAIVSGPAQKVDGRPPSRASEATTEFNAASASRRSERYTLDFPLPFAPVITFSCPSGSTSSRSDRYPWTATVWITVPIIEPALAASLRPAD